MSVQSLMNVNKKGGLVLKNYAGPGLRQLLSVVNVEKAEIPSESKMYITVAILASCLLVASSAIQTVSSKTERGHCYRKWIQGSYLASRLVMS